MDIKVAGFIKNSFVDYPGNIASVVFLGGCNFACHYCHNNHILANSSNTIDFNEVLGQIKEQVGFIDGVVISGGEPTMHPHLYDIIREIKALGLLIKLDTNGTDSKMLIDLVEKRLVDYVAMDIKASLERYRDIVRADINTSEIKKSIDFLKNQKMVDYMFRTTLSPHLTDNDIKKICELVKGAECFQLQQFVPNAYSNNSKTVLLPYSRDDAERFGLILAPCVKNFVIRGF